MPPPCRKVGANHCGPEHEGEPQTPGPAVPSGPGDPQGGAGARTLTLSLPKTLQFSMPIDNTEAMLLDRCGDDADRPFLHGLAERLLADSLAIVRPRRLFLRDRRASWQAARAPVLPMRIAGLIGSLGSSEVLRQ